MREMKWEKVSLRCRRSGDFTVHKRQINDETHWHKGIYYALYRGQEFLGAFRTFGDAEAECRLHAK
jgi:Ni/Co efflux regulator RcnB